MKMTKITIFFNVFSNKVKQKDQVKWQTVHINKKFNLEQIRIKNNTKN